MTEDSPSLTRTFTLGQVFCVVTSIPLFGERTFDMTREPAEYLLGIEPPVTAMPDIRDTTYLDYLIWTSAISQIAGPMIFMFMTERYPATRKLQTMPDFTILPHDDVMQMVEDFMMKCLADGIDFTAPIDLIPFPPEIQVETREWMQHRQLRDQCHRQLLSMKSAALVAA